MSDYSSKNYSWNDISIAIGGRIIEGIEDVEYSAKQEKSVLRGRGGKGHKITRGNKDFEGKINLWQSEVEAMIKDAPNKDILALSFDIIWSFIPDDGGATVTDVLTTCEITEYKKAMKQGDKNMLVELPFIFLDVKNQQ
ncbi:MULTISPECIES: hypothetical protein [Flavobacterium]|uniref:Phage tail protein n=1 Tax=Flavobacterium soyangense TaxID=2023265 RepID=A0A930XY70_9FLAO|nr:MULTISPECIES: hypothetical protein [Flavobacterium]MBF2707523.1 hypothetical protein [Flavobacterium soyangense]MDI6049608.1 hypothetical protein [Flavobacterium sp. XS2P24]